MGESVEALVAEIEEAAGNNYVRQLLTDSSAIAIASEGSVSWRTRHLRVRAFNLRWRMEDQSWTIHHVPGVRMLADLGTKALSGKRMEELRRLWKLEQLDDQKDEDASQEEQVGVKSQEDPKGQAIRDIEKVKEESNGKNTPMIKVITIASLISQVQAVKEKLPESETDDESLKALTIVLFKMVEMAVAQKPEFQNGTLVSGNMDQNPRNPSDRLILSHTQMVCTRHPKDEGYEGSRTWC